MKRPINNSVLHITFHFRISTLGEILHLYWPWVLSAYPTPYLFFIVTAVLRQTFIKYHYTHISYLLQNVMRKINLKIWDLFKSFVKFGNQNACKYSHTILSIYNTFSDQDKTPNPHYYYYYYYYFLLLLFQPSSSLSCSQECHLSRP